MSRYLRVFLLAMLSLDALLMAAPAGAAPRTRCFPETNFCVSSPILEYWERNGGLPVFGYPITDLHTETIESWTGPVQWFERDRLEDHGPIGVLAGRLGAQLLETQGRPWQTFSRVGSAPRGCQFFSETGHSLCEPFLSYWRNNGGLERFGYPISEPMEEVLSSDGSGARPFPVQYFERRRMERHTELSGTPYEVLLGLLGREIYLLGGCQPADPPLGGTAAAYRGAVGCPRWSFPSRIGGVGAVEPFERGAMLWIQGAPSRIYVIYFDVPGRLTWQSFIDTWHEGGPVSGGETPPPGLYEPIRGFGQLWRTNNEVRGRLGWATAPEQVETGTVQDFTSGARMLYRASADRVYILYSDGRADDVARIP